MKTSEVLNKAADLIEERGWTQGVPGFYGPRLCVEGSLMCAMSLDANDDRSDMWESPAYVALAAYLGITGKHDDSEQEVWRWNDNVAQSATEVIATLRAAAVIEAARETPSAPADVRVGTGVGARVGG